jgi:cell division protein FtsI/penicillin-binding protein 2
MRLLAPLALLVIAGVVAFFLLRGEGEDPAALAIDRYVVAWTGGDDAQAAALTDRPKRAAEALEASRRGLDGARVRARVVSRTEDGARVRVTWEVPGFGPFAYAVRLTAVEGEPDWRVRWRETAVHPGLDGKTRLGTAVDRPRRGKILDRDGRALVTERAVVDVGVEVDKARSTTAARIAALVDVDADELQERIDAAPAGRFLPVITLRAAAFAEVEDELTVVPGVSLNRTKASLAPSSTFARALLGSVGPVTAEQVEASQGRLAPGEVAGRSGLEGAYDERLAGSPTRRVVVRYRSSGGEVDTLARKAGKRGRSLRTRLDLATQAAAERALKGVEKGALVVVEPSSGDVLAAANRPADDFDRALQGRYPPGSTFKVVSTAALLRDGLDTASIVDCPPTLVVEGKSFRNFEGGAAGAVPFSTDFAQSCNTAFVSLADRLGRDDLPSMARAFGLGEKLSVGVPAADADVPAARDDVGQAAMMIGQDRILASPLAMAGVAATVAEGRWRAPRVLADAPKRAGERLPAAMLATLRTLMRSVVTSGTGTALADLPGEVRGKSGTAEYGGGDPPPTHAWFIAMRGDLALAVLVEDGESGGRVAAPVARRFFEALG